MKRYVTTPILCLVCGFAPLGCGKSPPGRTPRSNLDTWSTVVSNDPLPLDVGRARLTRLVLDSLRKPVMGRRLSLPEVQRIVTQVAPIVAAAARQPQADAVLAHMAHDSGISLEQMRSRWVALLEADLLLESGGDPDAISISNAAGVAQWLAGTGAGAGLAIDRKESERLTHQINALRLQIAWRRYLLRPDADPGAPGAPPMTRAEVAAGLPALQAALDPLLARRRRVDARFDPQTAIFAQTRYLLRLYSRFPAADWLFQAYHGGEAGVERTLRLYCRRNWPGSAAAAIVRGRAGRALRFEDLYFTTTPRATPEAFAYLYGRSDDHRHYWWKIRVSMDALALYRRDPGAFEKQWEALFPNRPMDAVWYPDGPAHSLPDVPALQAALARGSLVSVSNGPDVVVRPAPADLAPYGCASALRPEARGALMLVAAAFRRAGSPAPLVVGDVTFTQAYADRARLVHPAPPPKPPIWPPNPDARTMIGGGPPFGFDYHTTGLAFDLVRPADARQRKLLEYVLGYLMDRRILSWIVARDQGEVRYHIIPNPRYAGALARLQTPAQVPALPGL